MDHNAPALEQRAVYGQSGVVVRAVLVVVDHLATALVPDLDAETIGATAATYPAVNGREGEGAVAVSGPRANPR